MLIRATGAWAGSSVPVEGSWCDTSVAPHAPSLLKGSASSCLTGGSQAVRALLQRGRGGCSPREKRCILKDGGDKPSASLDQIWDWAVRWEGTCGAKHVRYKQETAENPCLHSPWNFQFLCGIILSTIYLCKKWKYFKLEYGFTAMWAFSRERRWKCLRSKTDLCVRITDDGWKFFYRS